jgi:tripartite-type tricarboxylate transporter receptor subunit TctC
MPTLAFKLCMFAVILAGVSALCSGASAQAQQTSSASTTPADVERFYAGRTINLMISSSTGGGYDLYARVVAKHMGRHIPGHPNLVPQNRPGAAGMNLLNWAYNQGPRDGSMFFTLHVFLPVQQALGGEAIRYDIGKLVSIGRVSAGNALTGAWYEVGVNTMDDVRAKGLIVGATNPSSNSAIFPTIANKMLGGKFKVITGYRGGEEVMLALERGELQGFGSFGVESMKSSRPDYITQHLVRPVIQWGLQRDRDWPDVPLASELTSDDLDRRGIALISAQMDVGRSYYLPPGVPQERIGALRLAFRQTIEDPAFKVDAEKIHLNVAYASGEEMQKIISDILTVSPQVVARLRENLGDILNALGSD